MTRSTRRSRCPFVILPSLLVVYIWLWTKIEKSSNALQVSTIEALTTTTPARGGDLTTGTTKPFSSPPEQTIGTTIIVSFCNYHFRSVGLTWYRRMTILGYDNHLLVATDQPMVNFLASLNDDSNRLQEKIRYDKWIHEPMPTKFQSSPRTKLEKMHLQLLMAVRWKYLVSSLERGVHVILSDADNIFSQYLDVEEELTKKDPTVDVYFAYATKFPRDTFTRQGFCVCSGMSWWRSSPSSIRLARLMRDTCGDMCDDQRELNHLLSASPQLNMTWQWTTEARQSRLSNVTISDPRYHGLPTLGISGTSSITGHKARIWDRDFAFRGPLLPDRCPVGNWVSMPITDIPNRQMAWKTKVESFQQWDNHCLYNHR